MTLSPFGRLRDTDIREAVLRSPSGCEARIITYGAILRDLVVPHAGGRQRVVLGFDTVETYAAPHEPYLGAIVGRYANRIADARFSLDGEVHRLVPNEGANQLHGGPVGFSDRIWTVIDHAPESVTLALVSADGDMGYPGRLVATATYALIEPMGLRLTLEATCDRPCPVNLTTHTYYNLDGSPTIDDHRLMIAGGFVTPTGPGKIPTGEIAAVSGTPFDFREPRRLAEGRDRTAYDINYVLDGGEGELARAATLVSDRSGLTLDLWTSEPGLQFYDGHMLDLAVPGHDGARYGPRAGLCLEPQRFPDGPNRAYFPPCILEPGSVSRQVTEMRFGPARERGAEAP